jgi:hypothetical protein
MLLNPEAHSKIFLQKRAVLESKFKKHLLKQPFFGESVHESADVQFQIKQNGKWKIYSKLTKFKEVLDI